MRYRRTDIVERAVGHGLSFDGQGVQRVRGERRRSTSTTLSLRSPELNQPS